MSIHCDFALCLCPFFLIPPAGRSQCSEQQQNAELAALLLMLLPFTGTLAALRAQLGRTEPRRKRVDFRILRFIDPRKGKVLRHENPLKPPVPVVPLDPQGSSGKNRVQARVPGREFSPFSLEEGSPWHCSSRQSDNNEEFVHFSEKGPLTAAFTCRIGLGEQACPSGLSCRVVCPRPVSCQCPLDRSQL